MLETLSWVWSLSLSCSRRAVQSLIKPGQWEVCTETIARAQAERKSFRDFFPPPVETRVHSRVHIRCTFRVHRSQSMITTRGARSRRSFVGESRRPRTEKRERERRRRERSALGTIECASYSFVRRLPRTSAAGTLFARGRSKQELSCRSEIALGVPDTLQVRARATFT